jgi:uncharacterized NAD-dependent epimerase/dehydratase family protein
MKSYLTLAQVTNQNAQFVAISLNTDGMTEDAARAEVATIQNRYGITCFDPLRFGIDGAVERIRGLED